MTNSINTNIAAFSAQGNITRASDLAAANVARLSSGNAIIQASDNVAALAVGTSLATQVNVLKTAQGNAAQGTSLLQVADGALGQIQSILQTMQSVAQQAQSGSLTDTNRGFLDQEFQKLANEVDALAKGTQFNGVNLIDGSIATGGSNNPLRDATIASKTTNAAATISGFTAGTDITAVRFNLDTTTANDTTFVGALSGGTFTVAPATTDANVYTIGYAINGSVYSGSFSDGGSSIALDNGKGTITFAITDGETFSGASLQTEFTNAFAGATAFAIHKVATVLATDSGGNNIAGSAITATSTAGSLLDGFSGSNVTVSSALFNSTSLPSISNFSATGIGTGTVFSVVVNGTTYSTTGSVTSGPQLNESDLGADDSLVLYKKGVSTSNEKITLDLSGIGGSLRIDTAANVAQAVSALNSAFGSGGNQGGLIFQLGTSSAANVTINIANSQSSALFAGATLDVKTAGDAATAATAVTTALNTITATRASVGALETQFNFASAALQNSVQNQDAARSQLLDVDITTESTAFATNQVKLQAGISVLAQANQQTQALLKLIG